MSSFSAQQALLWGEQAGDRLIEDNIDLSTSIAKIAQEHSLNTEQIARVVEAANHHVWRRLHKTAMDRLFSFNVANLESVLGALQNPPSEVKAAGWRGGTPDGDYQEPPPDEESLSLSVDEVFDLAFPKVAENVLDARLRKREKLVELVVARNKVAQAQSHIQASQIGASVVQSRSEDELLRQAEQLLLSGKTWEETYHQLVGGGGGYPMGEVRSLMGRVLDRLKQKNLVGEGESLPENGVPPPGVAGGESLHKAAQQALSKAAEVRIFAQAQKRCQEKIAQLHAAFEAAERAFRKEEGVTL